MTRRAVAKFYRSVSVSAQNGEYVVLLDGKPIKTPGGRRLVLPTEALAEAIAQEWREQGVRVEPAKMPLTGLAYAASNLFPAHRGEIAEHVLGFGRNDLLCYRAEEPLELVRRQSVAWDPLLYWLREQHGVVLRTGSGLRFVDQPTDAVQGLAALVGSCDAFELVALDRAATITGSLVLALAMRSGHLDVAAVFAAAHVDESFQAEMWGRDAEAEARRGAMLRELGAAERFLRLSRLSRA